MVIDTAHDEHSKPVGREKIESSCKNQAYCCYNWRGLTVTHGVSELSWTNSSSTMQSSGGLVYFTPRSSRPAIVEMKVGSWMLKAGIPYSPQICIDLFQNKISRVMKQLLRVSYPLTSISFWCKRSQTLIIILISCSLISLHVEGLYWIQHLGCPCLNHFVDTCMPTMIWEVTFKRKK